MLYTNQDGMGDPVLDSRHVKQAYYSVNGSNVQIQVQFNGEGEKAYNELRTQNPGAYLYLRLDGQPAAYGALSALSDRGWIRLLPVAEGSRKKEYMLTEEGRRALRGELERLRELVACGDTVLGGSKDE